MYRIMPTTSTIADTNGLLISAGSSPSDRKRRGKIEPTSEPRMTTLKIVSGITSA
jgi:hypothetical protein